MAEQQERRPAAGDPGGGTRRGDAGQPMVWEFTASGNHSGPPPATRRDSGASLLSAQSGNSDSDSMYYTTTDDEVEQQQQQQQPPRLPRSGTRRRGRATAEPFWCHECQRGIQAAMVPAPTCPHCHGQFVEEVDEAHSVENFVGGSEDETDGEYEHLYHELQNADPARLRPTAPGSVPFVTFFTVRPMGPSVTRVRTPQNAAVGDTAQHRSRSLAEAFQNAMIQDTGNSQAAGNTVGNDANASPHQADGALPAGSQESDATSADGTVSASANAGTGQTARQTNLNNFAAGLVPGLLAEFLGALLGNPPEGQAQQPNPGQFIVQQIFHLASNPGDYVFGQNDLDNIITAMMEQQQGRNAPPPASEEVLSNLNRLSINDADVGTHCPVCKDDFALSDTAVRLPCTHLFHEDCIIPWLKVNGTCPTCRYSLVTSTENTEAGTSAGAGDRSSTARATEAGEPPQPQSFAPPTLTDSNSLPPPDPLD